MPSIMIFFFRFTELENFEQNFSNFGAIFLLIWGHISAEMTQKTMYGENRQRKHVPGTVVSISGWFGEHLDTLGRFLISGDHFSLSLKSAKSTPSSSPGALVSHTNPQKSQDLLAVRDTDHSLWFKYTLGVVFDALEYNNAILDAFLTFKTSEFHKNVY